MLPSTVIICRYLINYRFNSKIFYLVESSIYEKLSNEYTIHLDTIISELVHAISHFSEHGIQDEEALIQVTMVSAGTDRTRKY